MKANLRLSQVVRNQAANSGETMISKVAEGEVVAVVIMITIRVDEVGVEGKTTRTVDSRPVCMAHRTITMTTTGRGHPRPKNKKM